MDQYRALRLINGMTRSVDQIDPEGAILCTESGNPITLLNGSFHTFEAGWKIVGSRIEGVLSGPFASLPRFCRLKLVKELMSGTV